MTQMKATAD